MKNGSNIPIGSRSILACIHIDSGWEIMGDMPATRMRSFE
jgi:hypothetical protein